MNQLQLKRQRQERWPLPKTELTEKQKIHVANFRLCLADHPEYRKYHNFYKVSLKWWDWIKPMTVLPPNDNSIDEGIREILKAY